MPGTVLIGLSLGIGTAAYNSSSNILFITLSLLLEIGRASCRERV